MSKQLDTSLSLFQINFFKYGTSLLLIPSASSGLPEIPGSSGIKIITPSNTEIEFI